MILFDSTSEFYRYPQGGIRENDEITIKIYLRHDFVCTPKVIIEKRNDYNKEFYNSVEMKWISAKKNYDLYATKFKIKDIGNYYYSFELCNKNNNYMENSYKQFHQLIVYKKDYTTPDWAKGGIIYHIFVDRFYKIKLNYKNDNIIIRDDWGGIPNYLPDEEGEILNNDFFGGNLEGIILKLPYLQDLGITIIYLSPIFEAYSNHKYDTGDYFKIDPMFGNTNDLKRLCKEAKKHGISIILDGVFNHTGADSIYFNRYNKYKSIGAYQSKNSIYYDWYTFNEWNKNYKSWWGIKTLPTINKDNQDYIHFIMGENGVIKRYLNYGIKGYRLDVADELSNEFLQQLRTSIKSNDPDSLIIGEVWEDASNKYSYDKLKEYFLGSQLDSVTNYPLKEGIINYLKWKDCNLLYETMSNIMEKYPSQTVNTLMNVLGTHDTSRILTVLGSKIQPHSKDEMAISKLSKKEISNGINLLKIASLLQMTLPGIPCIYYGDESGMEGWKDPFNRRCFDWNNINTNIQNHYIFLSKLRKSSELFIDGKYKCHIHDKGVFVFERYNEKEKIIIGINLTDKFITLNLEEKMKKYNMKNYKTTYNINRNQYIILYSK